ncbi:MAG: membrane protease YdiL (CAAX protease family) [bacterium]|jgi:membrane protease YdiL (CAAX protease family)
MSQFVVFFYLFSQFLLLSRTFHQIFAPIRTGSLLKKLFLLFLFLVPLFILYPEIDSNRKFPSQGIVYILYTLSISVLPILLRQFYNNSRQIIFQLLSLFFFGLPLFPIFEIQHIGTTILSYHFRYDLLLSSNLLLFNYFFSFSEESSEWGFQSLAPRSIVSLYLVGGSIFMVSGVLSNHFQFQIAPFQTTTLFTLFAIFAHQSLIKEIFFRLICQSAIRSYFDKNFWILPVILISSFFSLSQYLIHQTSQVIFPSFIIGLFSGIFLHKKRSIILAWLVHASFVSIAFYFFNSNL